MVFTTSVAKSTAIFMNTTTDPSCQQQDLDTSDELRQALTRAEQTRDKAHARTFCLSHYSSPCILYSLIPQIMAVQSTSPCRADAMCVVLSAFCWRYYRVFPKLDSERLAQVCTAADGLSAVTNGCGARVRSMSLLGKYYHSSGALQACASSNVRYSRHYTWRTSRGLYACMLVESSQSASTSVP